jgi:ATP-dependent Zn protease
MKRETAVEEDFEFAKDRIRMGVGRKTMLVSDKDKVIITYY